METVRSAVRVISCMTRENIELGSLAFRIWKKEHECDAAECVDLARRQIYCPPEERPHTPADLLRKGI